MHALIIEDEPMIALVIEDFLRESGFISVDIAATQTEAVEIGCWVLPGSHHRRCTPG